MFKLTLFWKQWLILSWLILHLETLVSLASVPEIPLDSVTELLDLVELKPPELQPLPPKTVELPRELVLVPHQETSLVISRPVAKETVLSTVDLVELAEVAYLSVESAHPAVLADLVDLADLADLADLVDLVTNIN